MKPKKIEKKLWLNKKNIANLNGNMMGKLHGGVENTQTIPCCLGTYTACTEYPCNTDQSCVTCETCATCETQACATCKTCLCATE